jgi:(4-(4-[2-(gamma-L-glutamylamino)ethyl]phenoxymethyl)furan-2-yl)methanamine synthase
VRTPVMAVVRQVPCEGRWQPLVAELFATMADVYRLTGELDEEDDMQEPADGAGKQVQDSARRLARMLGTDMVGEFGLEQWRGIARYITEMQMQTIEKALHKVWSRKDVCPVSTLVGAGAGRFLVTKLAARSGLTYTDFADILTCPVDVRRQTAQCAAAVAVAQLARINEWA